MRLLSMLQILKSTTAGEKINHNLKPSLLQPRFLYFDTPGVLLYPCRGVENGQAGKLISGGFRKNMEAVGYNVPKVNSQRNLIEYGKNNI